MYVIKRGEQFIKKIMNRNNRIKVIYTDDFEKAFPYSSEHECTCIAVFLNAYIYLGEDDQCRAYSTGDWYNEKEPQRALDLYIHSDHRDPKQAFIDGMKYQRKWNVCAGVLE